MASAFAEKRRRLTAKAIRQIAHRYNRQGLNAALYEKQRLGAEPVWDAARIVGMVCSEPQEGLARWTVRLIAEESVKLKLVPGIGPETIRIFLQNHNLKPWREKSGAGGILDESYMRKMEDALATYEKASDPAEPVVCLDENRSRCTRMCAAVADCAGANG